MTDANHIPTSAQGRRDSAEILKRADELHDLGFNGGWNAAIEECAKLAEKDRCTTECGDPGCVAARGIATAIRLIAAQPPAATAEPTMTLAEMGAYHSPADPVETRKELCFSEQSWSYEEREVRAPAAPVAASDAIEALEFLKRHDLLPSDDHDHNSDCPTCNAIKTIEAVLHSISQPPAAPVETPELIDRLLTYADNCKADGMIQAEADLRAACDCIIGTKSAINVLKRRLASVVPQSSADTVGQAANKPAIDPKKIKAIDDFLEDGQRDKGYRAFAMMRHIWPQLREMALASSQTDEAPYRLPFHDETMADLASLTIRKEASK